MESGKNRCVKADHGAVILRLFCDFELSGFLLKWTLYAPRTRPVDLLAHFLWTSGLSSPPEGPPALLSTGSSCTRGACSAPPARRAATPAALEAGRVCPGLLCLMSGRACRRCQQSNRNKTAFYCFLYTLIVCYIPSSMKYVNCKKSCWIKNK